MDDDVLSDERTLHELTGWLPKLEVRGELGVIRGEYGRDLTDFVETGSFAWRGILIKKEVVISVGLPEKKFFLYGSDVEYALRIGNAGYKMNNVHAGRLKEIIPTERRFIVFFGVKCAYYAEPFRLYYAHRNGLYTYIKYRQLGKALRLVHYGIRGILLFIFRGKQRLPAAYQRLHLI